jgi:4-amino-4-deoxy-L-arabinose transferase-like glycosyltransferase
VLAKGLPPVIVAGLPIGVGTLRAHGWRGLGRLRLGLGLVVAGAIVLPWHVAVALRHPGFAWDYVVNQHLLFFLDRKLPRDSEGDPLLFFWAAFVLRMLPWIPLVPLAAREGLAALRPQRAAAAEGTLFLWVWMLGLLAFFSLAPSRLEHYALPAAPAAALLAARGATRLGAADVGRVVWRIVAALTAATAVAGALLLGLGERLFAGAYWIAQAPDLPPLIAPAGVVLLTTGTLATLAALARRASALVAVMGAAAVPMLAIVLVAQARVEVLFSWRPLARAVVEHVPPTTEVVFEAPEEYQIVGGLTYYSGRRITLLEPPGFVPPTYLAPVAGEMFLGRADFMRRWQSGERLAFVSDSQQRRDTPDGLVPAPFRVLAHFGDRWLLTNVPDAG